MTIRDFTTLPGELKNGIWYFPIVWSTNRNGKRIYWQTLVKATLNGEAVSVQPYLDNKPTPAIGIIDVISGQEGGKVRETSPTIVSVGLNIGKINETNAVCQAMRDALSNYNKYVKKAGPVSQATLPETAIANPAVANPDANVVPQPQDVKEPELTNVRYPPMLAQVLTSVDGLPAVVHIQKKYNGLRCVAHMETGLDGSEKVTLYSRTKGEFPGLMYIRPELENLLKEAQTKLNLPSGGFYIDGEIYKHGVSLQEISGQARKGNLDVPQDKRLNYIIYDCFAAPDTPFGKFTYSQRFKTLSELSWQDETRPDTYCRQAPTFVVKPSEVMDLYKRFIDEKYEGAMVRLDSTYKFSYNQFHCADLLKLKPRLDHEFKVVGWETGKKGKAADAIMIICVTTDGKIEFPVTPAMKLPERIALAKLMKVVETNGKTHFENNYLDREIIVYFDEYSLDKVPLRASTKLEKRTWE